MSVAEKFGAHLNSHIRALSDVVWRNFVAKPRELETDLLWLEKQISVKGLNSRAYFEKYIVASVNPAKIKELVAAGTDHATLQPQTLFAFPS